jgi:predicted nucleotide-binding protein (sugar kinase/HSP70/actin superfamily)
LEYCPKFFGLPDLAKILVKTKILTETFDEKKEKFEESLVKLGKKLGKKKEEIERAFQEALKKEKEIREKQENEALEKLESNLKKIILISHPYNLYDEYVNLRIKERLEKLGAIPIFIDKIPISINQQNQHKSASDIKFHWEFAKEIMEKTNFVLDKNIDGAIEISSFACGCDAVLKEFVEKKFKENKIPFLYLIIDEHTGEAGFQTRLEAFVDTLK